MTKRYKAVTTAEGAKKRTPIDRSLYLRMLRDTQKYPLLVRVASELWRAGFNPRKFFRVLHKDDYTLSTRIMEELERIDRGRNGYDPERVPPILPVLLQYQTTEELKEERKGRPSSEEAKKVVEKWISSKLKLGWKEVDLVRALREFIDPPEEDVVSVKAFVEDTEPTKGKKGKDVVLKKTVTKHTYHVCDGKNWHDFISPIKAREFQTEVANNVLAVIKSSIPMEQIKRTTCECCGHPLNGQVLSIRDNKGKIQSNLHPNCWWLHRESPCKIPLGMTLLHPAEGVAYTWYGSEKGGWKKTPHETVVETPKEESKPPAPVAAETTPDGFVRKV